VAVAQDRRLRLAARAARVEQAHEVRVIDQVRSDRFVQSVKGAAGDVVLWDNFAVMHAATPTRYSDADGERRVIHRLTVVADRAPVAWVAPAR
jgi:alpha-ketoglutarate-dependent taurine dioxygenase